MQVLVSAMVSFTAPEVLSSGCPKSGSVVELQPCMLGSSSAAAWLCYVALLKVQGGMRRLSSSLRLSPPTSSLWAILAKQVSLWAGRVEEVLRQLGLSSLAEDLDQTSLQLLGV